MSGEKQYFLGRYQIQQRLGKGGMASVFRAWDPSFNRAVAIKLLHPQYASNPRVRQRFAREAHAIARLEHPAIVPVYDYGQQDQHIYIAMRLMEGGTLEDRFKRGLLSMEEIVIVMNRVSAALDFAHQQGMVHRDIKPGNILYDGLGQPFLADFGIVKLVNSSHSDTVDMLGTPAYMSPEQVSPTKPLDKRSDVYSLGVVLFEMLTGLVPFESDTSMKTAMMHVMAPIPKLADMRSSLEPRWQKVIERAMAKKPENRYQSAGELAQAVLETAQEIANPSRAKRSSLLLWAAGGGGALLIALLLLTVMLNGIIPIPTPTLTPIPSIVMTTPITEVRTCDSAEDYQISVMGPYLLPEPGSPQIKSETLEFKIHLIVDYRGDCPFTDIVLRPRSERDDIISQIKWNRQDDFPLSTIGMIDQRLNEWVGGDFERLNNLDEQFDIVIEGSSGEEIVLLLTKPLTLKTPPDWIKLIDPIPTFTPTIISPTNTTDRISPTPIPTTPRPIIVQPSATPRPTVIPATTTPFSTDTPVLPTNTALPPTEIPTATPNYLGTAEAENQKATAEAQAGAAKWSATQTKNAEEGISKAKQTEQAAQATATKIAAENAYIGTQTREAQNQIATREAAQKIATQTQQAKNDVATLQAQETVQAYQAQLTQEALKEQFGATQTRQAQETEQAVKNYQATQTVATQQTKVAQPVLTNTLKPTPPTNTPKPVTRTNTPKPVTRTSTPKPVTRTSTPSPVTRTNTPKPIASIGVIQTNAPTPATPTITPTAIPKDSDGDGFPDEGVNSDFCPTVPGIVENENTARGCPYGVGRDSRKKSTQIPPTPTPIPPTPIICIGSYC